MSFFPKNRAIPKPVCDTPTIDGSPSKDTVIAPSFSAKKAFRKRQEWTRESVMEMLVKTNNDATQAALAGIRRWKLKPGLHLKLAALAGTSMSTPNLLASNANARITAGAAFVALLLEMQGEHPERRFYHATFIDDRIRTTDLNTVVDIAHIGKRVRALLREQSIPDWFGTVELQPYTNWRAGRGRDLALHIHVVFWADVPIDVDRLERTLAASRRLVTVTGAPTVTIKHREGWGELAHMAAYLFKGPERGANLVGGKYRRTGRSAQYQSRMRTDQAVRVMEVLSHLKLTELLLSSGEGKRIRSHLIVELHRMRAGRFERRELTLVSVPAIWRRARRQANKRAYAPVIIRRPDKNETATDKFSISR